MYWRPMDSDAGCTDDQWILMLGVLTTTVQRLINVESVILFVPQVKFGLNINYLKVLARERERDGGGELDKQVKKR